MKKSFLFLLLITCCQLGNAQNPFVDFEYFHPTDNLSLFNKQLPIYNTTEAMKDAAYEAPTSKLTNKKWCQIGKFTRLVGFQYKSDIESIYDFNANGTGKFYENGDFFYIVLPLTWKRAKDKLTITCNWPQATVVVDKEKIKDWSLRRQEAAKERVLEGQKEMRKKRVSIETNTIIRLEDDILVLDEDAAYVSKKYIDNILEERAKEAKLAEEAAKRAEEEAAKRAEEEAAKRAEEEAAKRAEEEAKRRIAEEVKAANGKAYEYVYNGQFDEAIVTIDKAIEIQPDNANLYDTKGEILYIKGDKEGAKTMWDKVVSLDPNFKDNNSNLNILINHKRWFAVKENFPSLIPFKKIRVLNKNWSSSQDCCALFTNIPDKNRNTEETDYVVQFYEKEIYFNKNSSIKFKKCTNVGDGWVEYEFDQPVFFSHYQKNAPTDRLMVLIE